MENTAVLVVSLSLEEKTVENTILSCQQLQKRIMERVKILDETSKINGSAAADLAITRLQDLYAYAYQVSFDSQFSRAFETPSIKRAFQKAILLPFIVHKSGNNQGEGRVEATISATWGGSEGIQYEAEVTGSVSDGKGNYVEAKAEHNFNSGEGRGSVSVGTISEKD